MFPKQINRKLVVLVMLMALLLMPVLTSAQSVLPYGTGVVGQINAQSPLLIYAFNGTTNDFVTVQVVGMTPGFSPTVSLNSPTQQQLGNASSDPFTPGSGTARIDVQLPQDGTYTLLVGNLNGQSGDFVVRVDGRQLPNPVPLSNAPINTVLSAQLPVLAFSFTADPDSPSTASLQGDFLFGVSVLNADGRLIATFEGGPLSPVHFIVPSGSGTYTLVVFSKNGDGGAVSAQLRVGTAPASSSDSSSNSGSSSSDSSSSTSPNDCNVVANNVGTNVRTGPGTNYAVLGQFETSIATGYANNWYVINFGTGSGWVYSGVVTVNGTCNNLPFVNAPPAPPTSTATADTSTSSPTHTPESDSQPTHTPESDSQPTHTPTPTTASVQTAPEDSDHSFAVDRDNGGTFNQVISYPNGDRTDFIEVTVNLGQLSPDNARNVSIQLSCSGTGTENVSFTRSSFNAQRYYCGDTIVYRYAHPYSTMSYYVFIDGGSDSYVNYTLTATTAQ